jgi:hypothetical protein
MLVYNKLAVLIMIVRKGYKNNSADILFVFNYNPHPDILVFAIETHFVL